MAAAFLATYRGTGGDVAALLRELALSEEAASQREIVLSLDALDAIAERAAEQAKDPNLGLHLATRLPHGSYGLLEYIGRSAPTVRSAGERFLRYSSLLNELVTFELETRADRAVFVQRVEGHPACVGRQAGEMFVGLVVRYLRELTDAAWTPVGVAFAHRAPADITEHAAFLRAPIAWSAGQNRVELPLSVLELPVVSRDAMVFSVLDEQAERLVAARPQKSEGLARVREKVRGALADGQPQLKEIARALHMSPRTLQRRLEQEGTSFQDVVDSAREELARIYMANPAYRLGEVAYLLGFSEISAFTRAFKRWTGMTPTEWRVRSNDLA